MIAVLFEAMPQDGCAGEYFARAEALAPLLSHIDGFVSIERFTSLSVPGKILSLSFWRDEAAIAHWRTLPVHRSAQVAGRGRLFADYRLRIAEVNRDCVVGSQQNTPADSNSAD